jgi:uncharacterized OsmC-like protein
MAETSRTVTISRAAPGHVVATNIRGGTISIGGGDQDFTPTELLLTAIGSCTALDVNALTSRRAEPEAFEVRVDAEKIRDEKGNRLVGIVVTFGISFPDGDAGDAARTVLPDAVRKSHERLCTVGRTVELGTPIENRISGTG